MSLGKQQKTGAWTLAPTQEILKKLQAPSFSLFSTGRCGPLEHEPVVGSSLSLSSCLSLFLCNSDFQLDKLKTTIKH